jgi:hypothetical protein
VEPQEAVWLSYRRHLAALLERHAPGLLPGPESLEPLLEARTAAGERFVDRRLREALRETPEREPEVVRVAGHGALIGEELAFQLGAAPEHTPALADACALVNLLVASFDHTLDRGASGADELLEAISRPRLRAALVLEHDGEPAFPAGPFGDRSVALTVAFAEKLFADSRRMGRYRRRPRWRPYVATVLAAYDAELASTGRAARRPSTPNRDLDRKSALPSVMMIQLALMLPEVPASVSRRRAIRLMRTLGEIAGLADDLCDLREDVELGCDSNLLLEMPAPPSSPGERLGFEDTVTLLLESSTIARAVSRIEEKLRRIAGDAEATLRYPARFQRNAELWLSTWFADLEEYRSKRAV